MRKKPAQPRDEDVTDLNVEIPTEMMVRIKVAKAITGESIREIARAALDAWLREHGVTPDKMPKVKGDR